MSNDKTALPQEEQGETSNISINALKVYKNTHSYGIVGQHEAKQVLEDNLKLMALSEQPQKIISLEGAQGTGKTTLIESICREYRDKYPDKLVYTKAGISDLTEGIHTSAKIDRFWLKLSTCNKPQILFIDEADEVLITRMKGTHIRGERTTTIITKLNLNIKNLLIILATNRPGVIDPAIKGRIMERVECTLPTHEEMIDIISLHLPFLDESMKTYLTSYTETSNALFNGRDIYMLSNKLKAKIELHKLAGEPEIITDMELIEAFGHIERSKRKLNVDYLEVEV